jgi:hypothetical protein
MTRADFTQTERIVQRQRMRDPGLVELRRHHPDVVGQSAGDFLDDLQAGGVDAVVIGAENSHAFRCPFRPIPSRSVRRLIPLAPLRQTSKFSQNARPQRAFRRIMQAIKVRAYRYRDW